VFVPNMADLTRRLRDAFSRRSRAAPPAMGSGHD
jgi:hypothetical protein